MSTYIGALDLGTTSNRFILFDPEGRIKGVDQKEHTQIFPKPGWVEHDPMEIWENACSVIKGALGKVGVLGKQIAAIGITNQRETAVVWDRQTGKPLCNAIVWQCTRTDAICRQLEKEGGQDRFRAKTGLPIATYFSGPKIKWILDNVTGARTAAENGRALFGTVETWIIWQLTGGTRGGAHVTDVTNASRTLLMNIETLAWDDEILACMGIPRQMLPRIVPSIDKNTWGHTLKEGPLGATVPVCGALGDQQAATVGQTCFEIGEAKNTYGTGCFMLLNTGTRPVPSAHGLLTTVGYQISGQKAGVLPGRIRGHRRCVGPVAAGQPGVNRLGVRGGNPGPHGGRQWRCLFRAGLFRSLRPLLARGCPWCDRRTDPVCQQGPYRQSRVGSQCVPDPGHHGGHEQGFGSGAEQPQSGRRNGGPMSCSCSFRPIC